MILVTKLLFSECINSVKLVRDTIEVIVKDAVASYKCKDYEKSLQLLSSKGVNLLSSTDVSI